MNIVFDASILANHFNKNASRSGIFFVAKNILEQLLDRNDVKVLFYFLSENIEYSVSVHEELYPGIDCVQNFQKYQKLIDLKKKLILVHRKMYSHVLLRKFPALGLLLVNYVLKRTFENDCKPILMDQSNYFFSPIFKVPKIIRKYNKIQPIVFLHDAIPILYPHLSGATFAREIAESTSPSDIILFNSLCTQRDFERLYSVMRICRSEIVYLAASNLFGRNESLEKMNQVREKYAFPKGKRFVFSLCSLAPHKNLERNLRSFKMFIQKNKIDDLVWVFGGGSLAGFVEQLKKVGIDFNSSITKHIGYVDDEDLPVLYSNAEWFVYTSQYEGFGLPPLEAMQCGCPVIVSNNSSLPEVVGDAGILIDWDSDEQHVAAYEKYYFDKKFRDMKAAEGLERAKLFSWEKTVDQMVEVMKGC